MFHKHILFLFAAGIKKHCRRSKRKTDGKLQTHGEAGFFFQGEATGQWIKEGKKYAVRVRISEIYTSSRKANEATSNSLSEK